MRLELGLVDDVGEMRSTLQRRYGRFVQIERVEEERRLAEQELNEGMSINHLLVPLLYAPVLPLVRIGLRNRVPPERLTHISLGIIGVALSHAGYIMFSDSTIGFRET